MGRSSSFFGRMLRAARLDTSLYEEVEADRSATLQALFVVLLYSLHAGIGSGLGDIPAITVAGFFWNLFVGMVSALAFWLLWSLLTYVIGTTLLKGPQTSATYGELLRTIGFSTAPGLFMALSFIPFVGGLIALAALVWMFIAMVVAVRQALDFSTGRAIGTCLIGGVVYVVLVILLGLLFGLGLWAFGW